MSGESETRQRGDVHVAVYDGLADWEIGHTTAHLRQNGFRVVTVAARPGPVTTMGGLRILPELTLAELPDPAAGGSALLVLAGATDWPVETAPFLPVARRYVEAGVPVAAICGATAALAGEGLLDDRAHTSAVAPFLAATGYAGGAHYREADAVTGRGVITAGPTEPVAFAREVLAQLEVFEPAVLDAWFRLHQHSDAAAYEVVAAAEAVRG